MDWKRVAEKLASAGLPALAAAVGGPAGIAIGAAASIAKALGAAEATPEIIEAALDGDPDAIHILTPLDIRQAEITAAHAERMAEISTEDVQKAREVFKASPMPAVVFFTTSGMVTAFIATIMVWGDKFTADVWDYLKMFGPQLFVVWVGAGGYFVNSSLGSRNKERITARGGES